MKMDSKFYSIAKNHLCKRQVSIQINVKQKRNRVLVCCMSWLISFLLAKLSCEDRKANAIIII